VRLGYLLDTHAAPYGAPVPSTAEVQRSIEAFMAEAALCELHGFDSINVPDRHMRTETHFPNPLQMLTALAMETERCTLATHALVLTLYHPMHVAEQAAMIDHLSRGRLVMTVAMGYHDDYWRMFGLTRAGRRGRFIEAVEILRRAWAGSEPFSYDGEHFQLTDVRLLPQPYQPGGPELWIGGQVDASIVRAGELADGWVYDLYPIDSDTWERRIDLYKQSAHEHGRRTKVVLLREAWVTDTWEEALRYCEYMVAEHLYSLDHGMPLGGHPDFRERSQVTPENWAAHAVVGTAEQCAEKMVAYGRDMGVDELCVRLRRPMGPSLEETREGLQRFGEEVLPLVRAAL
jgi:alkanesulfonate monooxygenase SsuD/methylene tetrahydromethanopterin reductase-like flavin-dependent oxidoreductase (luciferase family)